MERGSEDLYRSVVGVEGARAAPRTPATRIALSPNEIVFRASRLVRAGSPTAANTPEKIHPKHTPE